MRREGIYTGHGLHKEKRRAVSHSTLRSHLRFGTSTPKKTQNKKKERKAKEAKAAVERKDQKNDNANDYKNEQGLPYEPRKRVC